MKTLLSRAVAGTKKVLLEGAVAGGVAFFTERTMESGRQAAEMIINKVKPVEVVSSRKITVGDTVIKGRRNCKKFLAERQEKCEKFDKIFDISKTVASATTASLAVVATNDAINNISGWKYTNDLQDLSDEVANQI